MQIATLLILNVLATQTALIRLMTLSQMMMMIRLRSRTSGMDMTGSTSTLNGMSLLPQKEMDTRFN